MLTKVKPEEIIPAEYTIHFQEADRRYRDYLVYPEPYDTKLRSDIENWLNDNAEGWKVVFDRGDFGDGSAYVRIYFPGYASMDAFAAIYAKGNCYEPAYCKNLVEFEEGNFECSKCGEKILLNKPDSDFPKLVKAGNQRMIEQIRKIING